MVHIPEPVMMTDEDHFELKHRLMARGAKTEPANHKLSAYDLDRLCDHLASEAMEFFIYHRVIKGKLGDPEPAGGSDR